MIMKIGHTKVSFPSCTGTVVAQTGNTLVELGFAVLEILEDTLDGTLVFLWCQWLKADVFESDVRTFKRNLHVGDVILEVQSLLDKIYSTCT